MPALVPLIKGYFKPKFIIAWLLVLILFYAALNGFLFNSFNDSGITDVNRGNLAKQLVNFKAIFKF